MAKTSTNTTDMKKGLNSITGRKRVRSSGMVRALDENGCRNAVAEWVEKGIYRSLIHRHDGTFTAVDESERKYMRADTIPLLADALLNWPGDAVEIPPTHYIRVPERPNYH